MNNRIRGWILLAALAVICGLAVGGAILYRSRFLSTAKLMKRLPTANALIVYVDFDALRRGGIQQIFEGSKVAEDPEYRDFVRQTDFNWKTDLDSALVSFAPTGNYMLLRGRFDWTTLRSYVSHESGQCYNALCRMRGSTEERKISFLPLQSGLMAMAVSPDDSAALHLETIVPGPDDAGPNAPVWLSIPASFLNSNNSLPEGTRMFAHALERAESVTLGFAPEGGRLAARLEVRSRDEQDAAEAAAQLTKITAMLRKMIDLEHQTPNPADLSGVLTSGSFKAQGRQVFGYWPIERSFVTNMLGK